MSGWRFYSSRWLHRKQHPSAIGTHIFEREIIKDAKCVERVLKLLHLIFLDGFFFDLLYLVQQFFDNNFANTVTAQTWEQCNTKNGQIAQQKVIYDWANVGERNKTTSSSQVVLKRNKKTKSEIDAKYFFKQLATRIVIAHQSRRHNLVRTKKITLN